MTPKQRQLLKEMVRKEILKKIDKPIKLQDLISENYKNWEIGKVMTMKDNPPFKTPKQIEEEKLSEAKGKWAVINANDVLNIFPEKVVDSQKEAEKIAKQMKQKDRYGKYQAVSVKKWNQAGKGKKIKEGKLKEVKGVGKVLNMAKNQSFGKLAGKTVDAMSAGLFKQVYDKSDDKSKEKINKMNEKQLYVFMTKLWSKFGKQVRI